MSSYSNPNSLFARQSRSWDDLDQKPVTTVTFLVPACCGYTLPSELDHGQDIGEPVHCPYCGTGSTVATITNKWSPAPGRYSVDGQDPVTLDEIRDNNEDLSPEGLEALEALLDGEETYIGITPITRVPALTY